MKIPITRPLIGDKERLAILEPLETGWIVQGPKVAAFERRFAEYVGVPFAVATTSCTTALHLSLVALGVSAGDEVVVPSFTWIATANAVEQIGARPVFADIDPATYNVDVASLEAAITPRTKALVPVSLFGLSAEMDPVLEVARRHGLRVVEDAACAVGTMYRGGHAGTRADAGCFSFHPRKSITTGEGGMIVTGDEALAALLCSLRDHGASRSDLTRHEAPRSHELPEFHRPGFNYRMTDLHGALGLAQMDRLDEILRRRTELARRYDRAFTGTGWLRTPVVPERCRHGYQAYVCTFAPESPTLANVDRLHAARNAVMDRLEADGIATRPGTHAVHMQHYYRERYGIAPEALPESLFADRLSLALPLFPQMTEEEQDYVVDRLGAAGAEAAGAPVGSAKGGAA